LANATGATIVFGPTAEAQFAYHQAHDGEVFTLGKVSLKTLHTPGHTPESTCWLLLENDQEKAVFTGDTLFVGDVGRPDLLDGVIISKEEQVRNLYNSLNQKIKTLQNDVIVYPGHGPGSLCGKSLGAERQSTIGQEKATNYALQDMDMDSFAELVLADQPLAPAYFLKNAIINRTGYDSMAKVLLRNNHALSIAQADVELAAGALVIDARPSAEFAAGHIPNAWHISLDGSFAVWAGTLIPFGSRLLVLATAGREVETLVRLARVGYENVAGYITTKHWQEAGKPLATTTEMPPEAFMATVGTTGHVVLDVRRPTEFNDGHIQGALNIELRNLPARLNELDPAASYDVYCAGGYRSIIAASILQATGFGHVTNVQGGYSALKNLVPAMP
jgi:rhodanese-related sulfurtransferase